MKQPANRFPYVANYVTQIDGVQVRQRVNVIERFRAKYCVVSDKVLRLPYRTKPGKQRIIELPPGAATLVAARELEPIGRHE